MKKAEPDPRFAVVACAATGQNACYDSRGNTIPCARSGQDAASQTGTPWPVPRFQHTADSIIDRLTGLEWWHDASEAGFPLNWDEAFEFIAGMNQNARGGHADWRLPNRRELHSLIDYGRHRPSLPADLPASNVFQSWYWTSTTAAIHPTHAWYVDLAGGRLFYGGKDQSYMVWPVRGHASAQAATGQNRCFDSRGACINCAGTGQDGGIRSGREWPQPRFASTPEGTLDRLTGLIWHPQGRVGEFVNWDEALACVQALNNALQTRQSWRLPNINELESLVDADHHRPALPATHPFAHSEEVYWSSTTSVYEPDWAWALYLDKGALGVGHKPFARFAVWPVRGVAIASFT